MTTFEFNLVDEPWIPVETRGRRRTVSIREALVSAHKIDGLSFAQPTQLPAVLRQVLLPILAHACGAPRDEAQWGALWRRGRLDEDAVVGYLDEHRPRFDLFHPEQPYAQVAGLRTAKDNTKPSALLIPAIASGNNVPLFSARTEADPPALTPAEAAVWLLHTHCWDTAAIKSGAVGDPRVKQGKTTGNPTGPLGQLGVVVPIGRTLFETLVLNLPIHYDGLAPGDRPQWCGPPAGPAWQKRAPLGLLDLWTWQARRIRLVPEDTADGPRVRQVVVAAGDRLLSTPEYEPHAAWRAVRKPKAGDPPQQPLKLRSGHAAWRGLDALLAVSRREDDADFTTSSLLDQIGGLTDDQLPSDYPLDVATVGVEYGNKSAVVDNVIADRIPLPVAALRANPTAHETVEGVAADADQLATAINRLDADLRCAAGGQPTPRDRGQPPEPALIYALDPLARRLLATVGRRPATAQDQRREWQQAARWVVRDAAGLLLADAPVTTFAGRVDDGRVYRAADAERRFRRAVRETLYLAAPDDTAPRSQQEASG